MVVLAALLMLFMIVFSISMGGSANLIQARESVSAQRNAYAAAAAINLVYLAGDGARYNLTLGTVLDDENITMSEYSVTSMRDAVSASAPLLDGKMNASALSRGDFLISNEGGEIHISGR
jgi:uncharacterized protein YfiM (DUF2279 family)